MAHRLAAILVRVKDERSEVVRIVEANPWRPIVAPAGIEDVLAKRIIEHHGDSLLWPTFLEAQDAVQSDRQRARESRARRRTAVTKRDAAVTNRDASVTDRDPSVTPGHASGQRVTPATLRNAETGSASSKQPDKLAGGNESDQKKQLFDSGVRVLTATGIDEQAARSLIGKLRKHHGDEKALGLVSEAANKSDPRTWLAATLTDASEHPYVPMGRG
jgi:hypothetical protein